MEENRYTIMTVHAHPDDEVVFTGGVLLLYKERGVKTVLVTATNGEEGEIHDPDLDPEEARTRLGEIRREELRKGVEILGIDHHELLNYRDSGMAGTEANNNPECFHQADTEEATRKLVALVRKYKPHILITYDENGAYGHPDHIKCNVITRAAFEKAGDGSYAPELGESWQPLKLYYTHWVEERWKQTREMYLERGLKWPWDEEEQQKDEDPEHQSTEEAVAELQEKLEETEEEQEPSPDDQAPGTTGQDVTSNVTKKLDDASVHREQFSPPVTTRIDVTYTVTKKLEAARVHRTQFSPDGLFNTMPPDIAEVAFGEEHYSLVESRVPAPEEENDLLAGIA